MRRKCIRLGSLCLGILLTLYVGSYYVLSRRGFREADELKWHGFYFVNPPRDSPTWRRWNYSLVTFYSPLIWIDNALGTGRTPASEPMWGLGGGEETAPDGQP
jgi:hypothetical protein